MSVAIAYEAAMDPITRFVTAARGGTVDRPPVWLMRQAGRYLPEYRALRKQHGFLEMCRTPELAAEVTLQPWRRFGMDGVVIFCDILIPIAAMGQTLTVEEGGPRLDPLIATVADVERLRIPDPMTDIPFLLSALRQVRATLNGQGCLIGFAGAPWTLALYMLTGGGVARETGSDRLLQNHALRDALMRKLTTMLVPYLAAQVDAGAQVLQIFDTWGGMLSVADYTAIALPVMTDLIAQVRKATQNRVPIIIYCNDGQHLLEPLGATGADVVSVDWRVTLTEARRRLPAHVALQGNLNPETMLQTPEVIRAATQAMLREAGTTGYIANLGHGVLKQTPVENVAAFVETVKGCHCERSEAIQR